MPHVVMIVLIVFVSFSFGTVGVVEVGEGVVLGGDCVQR